MVDFAVDLMSPGSRCLVAHQALLVVWMVDKRMDGYG